jgi:hypothetical protein
LSCTSCCTISLLLLLLRPPPFSTSLLSTWAHDTMSTVHRYYWNTMSVIKNTMLDTENTMWSLCRHPVSWKKSKKYYSYLERLQAVRVVN